VKTETWETKPREEETSIEEGVLLNLKSRSKKEAD